MESLVAAVEGMAKRLAKLGKEGGTTKMLSVAHDIVKAALDKNHGCVSDCQRQSIVTATEAITDILAKKTSLGSEGTYAVL